MNETILPVVTIDDPSSARRVAETLASAGIHCAEVVLRTPLALRAIAEMSRASDFTVGAGTVLSASELRAAADSGAQFIVSPGLDEEVVALAKSLRLEVLPGAATATEIQKARSLGVETVKFFPADQLGGADAIKRYAEPFRNMRFIPSGGVGPDNLDSYLALPEVAAVSGSWVAPRTLIRRQQFDEIFDLAAHASAAVQALRPSGRIAP